MNTSTNDSPVLALGTSGLEDLIERLVEIDANESPLISCYVDLTQPREKQIEEIQKRSTVARSGLRGQARHDFDDAIHETLDYLRRRKRQSKKALAVFSRWGNAPLFMALELNAPTENQVTVDSLPMIYPLVACKDKLNRFVVVMTSETEARILEVVIGQVTESILTRRPEIRKRVGREWTKEHFQSHKRNRHAQFLKEKVMLIEQLMAKKGYNHLIILGAEHNIARLTTALPKRVRELVINPKDPVTSGNVSEALNDAIQLFIEAEERESQSAVQRLHTGITSNGLGTAGHEAVLQALHAGQADTLVILDDYPADQREELVRAAIQAKVNVETVGESELLEYYGGAGCLLRYRSTNGN